MGLWSRLASFARQKMSPDEWWDEFGGGTRSVSGIAVNQLTALQVTTFLACVSILSEDVAKLPLHIYRRRADGGHDIATDHPVERLLQNPNDYQSGFEFKEQMQAALLMRSNSYAAIVRNGRGNPTALIPLNPDRVWIWEAPDGRVFYNAARIGPHETAMLRSFPQLIAADDMLHLRWLPVTNSLWGQSRLGLANEAIALALAQQELSVRLAANSTNLGGVLSTDKKLTDDVVNRLRKNWREKYGNMRNAGETAVLEQGLKWQPLGMTAQAAEITAQRSLQVTEVARLFRMPPHKLGVMERMAGQNLEQIDQDYMNNTVSSHLSRWEDKLSQTFGLAADGVYAEFDISKFLRASLQTRYLAYRTGIVGMFLTPNEARRAERLPDHPQGDTLYQPTNVAEIGFAPTGKETGPGSDVTGQAAPGGAGDGATPPTDESPSD